MFIMDYLLKCYFEQFANAPRHSLHDRRNRRAMVEYISTLIEGYSRGQTCDVQIPAREAIISIIRYHEDHRLENGSVCKMGKYHNILYVALKLCFDWQVKDTSTVIALLEHIYSCEKTFERLFIGALFGNRAPHYIAGWKSDFDNQEENVRAIVYFIDHATNGNLDLSWNNRQVRFIDIPIESCGKASAVKISVQLGLPDKLLILLRYGAIIEDSAENIDLIEYTLKRLMEFCHSYPYNLVSCLQLLLRVVSRIILNVDNCEEYNCTKDKILEQYADLIGDCILPVTRCGVEVPELKHLCRVTVRRRLWENYQLPNGIRELPVPDKLRRYLDILED